MIKLFSNGVEIKFSTTIFPDGTSQVWKVDPNAISPEGDNYILWLFENEAELMHVCQLALLLQTEYDTHPDLVTPYLPYGRQDKEIGNQASFALEVFKDILYHSNVTRIETFDAHSKTDMVYEDGNMPPVKDFHESILGQSKYKVVCFPDAGARKRYGTFFTQKGIHAIYCDKVREQLTGNILGLKVVSDVDLTNQKILIIDDICDGGMTFIKVAEALKPFNPKQIDLAVSHGLFSKGRQVLHDAGITDIFTTNSLLRNPDGFKVW